MRIDRLNLRNMPTATFEAKIDMFSHFGGAVTPYRASNYTVLSFRVLCINYQKKTRMFWGIQRSLVLIYTVKNLNVRSTEQILFMYMHLHLNVHVQDYLAHKTLPPPYRGTGLTRS
jgi:hypothetical protein